MTDLGITMNIDHLNSTYIIFSPNQLFSLIN